MANKPDKEVAALMKELREFGDTLDAACDAVAGFDDLAKKKMPDLPDSGAELDDDLPELAKGLE